MTTQQLITQKLPSRLIRPLIRLGFSTIGLFTLGLNSGTASAVDYNDAYWSSPNQNTDFVDNFATSNLNRNYWDVMTNIYVNGEDQDYKDVEYPTADWTVRSGQDDASALDGKVLNLKARYMDGAIQNYYGGVANQGKPLMVRAGRIESKLADNTTFTYGKFEARIKMPPARNGEFPAWWLLGNFPDVGWTACQELDIIEFTGANATVAPQTHWSAPYPAYGLNPVERTYASLGVNPSNQFVTYGVIKTPENVEFYINGVKTYSWGVADRGDMPWPYVTPMHMILNHAITHVEWPAVGNYNKLSTDPNVSYKTGYTTVVNGVTNYEYIDVASMATNIGRTGTDLLVDYVAHWPLPTTEPLQKYTDNSKYSFFRTTNNTKGFYSLRGWMAPVAVTADASFNDGTATSDRDNGPKNAADGYVGSKWSTPSDDNLHWVQIDYGTDKPIKYFWIEWSWNLPKSYDIYGKTSTGAWEFIRTSDQQAVGWATHIFDVNKTYRYIKLVTKGRISRSDPIWLLEFKAFEDVANVYPKPAGTAQVDRTINMLSNGTFTTDLNGWRGETYDGATPVYASVGGQAKITTTNQGTGFGSIQLHTEGFGLKRNYRYQISFKAKADTARSLQVRLSTDDLNPSTAGTYLLQNVSLGTTLTTYTYNVDFTASDNAGRLAFLLGNQGTATVYIDDVVIKEITYIGVGDPLVPAIDASNFSGASAGWETDWWGVAARAVDGATGNKASGNDGQSEGQDLWVSVKIDPNYEVKELWVAGDKSAPRSLDQFKAEYGNGNTMMNWTPSNGDGVYESFSNFASAPPVGEQNFKFWFRPPAGQLVEVSDVQLMAVDYRPYRIYTIGLDTGGAISPAGTLRYSKNNTDSATYTFTPPAGAAVANVIVDGVSLGAMNSYTFSNINKSHTLAVAYTSSGSNTTSSAISSSAPSSIASSSVCATCTEILLSNGKTTFASSQLQPSGNAVDGSGTTRWESSHGVTPSWITVDLGAAKSLTKVVIDWESANAANYTIQGSNDNANWTSLKTFTGGAFGTRTDTNTVSGTYRYVRINCTALSTGNNWGYSIWELKVYGLGAAASSSSASSIVGTILTPVSATASTQLQPASAAIDKNSGTRWESAINVDPSWVTLDFGAAKTFSSIAIDWEAANAANYLVQGSNDNANWTQLNSKTGGTFGTRTDTLTLSGSYRYLRIYGTARSTGNQWGYSIWEIRVTGQ